MKTNQLALALAILVQEQQWTTKGFGQRRYPHLRGCATWLCGGRLLVRLQDLGFVQSKVRNRQLWFFITKKGRAELRLLGVADKTGR